MQGWSAAKLHDKTRCTIGRKEKKNKFLTYLFCLLWMEVVINISLLLFFRANTLCKVYVVAGAMHNLASLWSALPFSAPHVKTEHLFLLVV